MRFEKLCEHCQKSFFSYPSANQRFCSLNCRTAFRFSLPNAAPGKEEIQFSCRECGTNFAMQRAYLTEYHKKYGRDPLYCSRKCSAAGRRKTTDAKHAFTCLNCGNTFFKSRKPGGRLYAQQKYCSANCKHEFWKKLALQKFEDGQYGRHIKRHGYVWISVPSLVTGKKHAIMEHRYVMQNHLGRELYPEETVHHRDGNRQHNKIENLELFSSRHGPGQRVIDKVQFAIDMLRLYPDFARAAGFELHPIVHANAQPDAVAEIPTAPTAPHDR